VARKLEHYTAHQLFEEFDAQETRAVLGAWAAAGT
jgi:hypothetical protein